MNKLSENSCRIIYGLLAIGILTLALTFAQFLAVKIVVLAAILVLGLLSAQEYCHFAQLKQILLPAALLKTGVICIIAAFIFQSFSPGFVTLPMWILLLFCVIMFLSSFKKVENALVRVSAAVCGLIYLAVPLGMLASIFLLSPNEGGVFWLAYLLVVTKSTDIGAYFGGKLFGRHKLIMEISPKKTIEGAILGVLSGIGISFCFYILGPKSIGFDLSWQGALYLGAILAIFGQVGDLIESLLKRDAQVKDSGSLPGFGGILDMLDSLLINAPILYLYLL